jgi:hypothetical protein
MVVFPNRLDSAELQAGVSAGFLGTHPGANVLFSLRRYMRFNLFPEPFVAATIGREIEKAFE